MLNANVVQVLKGVGKDSGKVYHSIKLMVNNVPVQAFIYENQYNSLMAQASDVEIATHFIDFTKIKK